MVFGPAEILDRIIATRRVETVFQPIVAIDTGRTVGFEALTRGPANTEMASPDALFGYAAQVGKLPELDWVCRASACRAALRAQLPTDLALFVNIEPAAARVPCPADLVTALRTAADRLQIVAEVTERSVTSDPAGLLNAVAEMREYTSRIALDDVGAHNSSQAMMSLLRPDIIKLDRSILDQPTTAGAADVITAVLAEAERTGAAILAEGIETESHVEQARSVGATLGQGWLYGHPGLLPTRFDRSPLILPHSRPIMSAGVTPFVIASQHRPVLHASKPILLALSRNLEDKGVAATAPSVLLATFQHAAYFDEPTKARYVELAARGIFTAAFAADLPTDPAKNVRGCTLSADDPLTNEWTVVVIGSHFAGGLFAREAAYAGTDGDRRFEVVISYDRELVLDASRPLMQRLDPIQT
jgi:EAL domain-containing protein (putative c-di-GMP-specific phosphodiesterase class I)